MINYLSIILIFVNSLISNAQILTDSEIMELRERLSIKFKGDSQIEVGGPYAGLEFHHGSPLLQRISFYYPVANSIDNSTDYWHRDTTKILDVRLKIDEGIDEEIGNEPWEYNLTPYRVSFIKRDSLKNITITYEFCKKSPAFVIKYKIQNTSNSNASYKLETFLTTSLRTCHTYNTSKADSYSYFNSDLSYRSSFRNIETGYAQLFILNAGRKPLEKEEQSNNTDSSNVIFKYDETLKPGEQFVVNQIIGCTTSEEFDEVTNALISNYENEINEYESGILIESFKTNLLSTGNEKIDFTYNWAKAVIAANRHYLDNDLVPMPCPAEYNFFFTHDVLVTDLAVVLYDLEKVKKDLLFLAKHKNTDNVLPHAYYWKDSLFVTEYSEIDNWNHLWFVLLCGKYLRHSGDIQLLDLLFPIINKSIEITLINKQPDDLMWAARPDGWDIGNSYGPRTFMTVLAIKAFKEYINICYHLQRNMDKLNYIEKLTTHMNEQLIDKLWSNELNYLINYYEDGSQDKHYYVGSLLAAHFQLLDKDKTLKMMNSAQQKLLDYKLGIYNVYPMDFHLLKDFLKFQGNEVGAPFYYANGGIWPNANAWYALGLINAGMSGKAYNFVNEIMTVHGILNSPGGQPAMYEYRISDKNNSEVYGRIDKPQFLWAAGWYIYTLYNLFGIKENEWNITINPFMPEQLGEIKLSLTLNGSIVPITISGNGKHIKSIQINNDKIPSSVIPFDLGDITKVNIQLGSVETPYLSKANGIISNINYNENDLELDFKLSSIENNNINLEIITPIKCKNLFCDGKSIEFKEKNIDNSKLFKIICNRIVEKKSEQYKFMFKDKYR